MPDAMSNVAALGRVGRRPRDQHYLGAVGRVKAGVSIAAAE